MQNGNQRKQSTLQDSHASSRLGPATRNYLLNALPEADFERLLPDLERVKLTLGQVIYRAEGLIDYVYFPDNSMFSVVANTAKGERVEVGVIGWEGITGADVLLGSHRSINENIIQRAGGAIRIKSEAIKKEFKRTGAFHDLALIFTRLLMFQVSQTAVCNRLHTVEERMARWLLLCHDRADNDQLPLTQEFLSFLLGANRPTITIRAIALQNAGFIDNQRGLIKIVNRRGLENFSCACYRAVKDEYDRAQQ